MKKMKKLILALVLISFLAVPAISLAKCADQTAKDGCEAVGCTWISADASVTPAIVAHCMGIQKDVNVFAAINNLVNWLFAILMLAAVVSITIGGFFFLTAGGKPESISKARDLIIYAIVGIAVALLAKGLTKLAEGIIG